MTFLSLRLSARFVASIGLVALTTTLFACKENASGTSATEVHDASPLVQRPRIVSVGSGVTESIYALGAGEDVVGVDTSSLFPEVATKLPQVGYQRAISAEGVLALKPTLVLASNEAGPDTVLAQIRSAGARVEVVKAEPTLEGAHERLAAIGALLGRDAKPAIEKLDSELAAAAAVIAKTATRPRVLVIYSRGPGTLHVFGAKTGADTMIKLAGGENAISLFEGSKPLTSESVVGAAPDVIVIPSRGLDSLGGVDGLLKVPGVAQTKAGKEKRIVPFDDLLLLAMGPRTGKAALELAEKLHPEVAPAAKTKE